MRKTHSLYGILLILFIFIGGCVHDTGQKEKSLGDLSLTIDEFNCEFDQTENKQIEKMANEILDGILYVNESIEPLNIGSIDNIDWDVQFGKSPNTFQLYLQCLNPVMILTKGFEINQNIEYLNCAKKIISSWEEYKNTDAALKNSFLWYDHGTALRAENLIYYLLVCDKAKYNVDDLNLGKTLEEHGLFLSDSSNYTENHNHGIFQDRALIYTAYYLNNKYSLDWVNIAKDRLEKQKEFAFNVEMVHVENSPGYQVGVMNIFHNIAEFLMQYGDDFGQRLYDSIKSSAEFIAWAYKPNGVVAEIGDTNSLVGETKGNFGLTVFDNEHLNYAATLGIVGEAPLTDSKVFPKSGYYFSRDWDKEKNATWIMFKSGYSSKTHKHADDNSFMLYSKGYDILVDPGWYNYITGDKYRDYLISSQAHNTIVVDDLSYSTTTENSIKVGIAKYEQNENFDYILGYNDMYEGVEIDRHFYNMGDAFLIYDNIKSEDVHSYKQKFHLSEVMSFEEISDNEICYRIADSGYKLKIRQLIENKDIQIIEGEADQDISVISRKMNCIDDIQTIVFTSEGDNDDFITLITIENEEGKIEEIQNIKYDQYTNTIRYTNFDNVVVNITLQERERISCEDISINKSDSSKFKFKNNCVGDSLVYAWYIINENTGEVLKTEYVPQNEFSFNFNDNYGESFLIKAYIKDNLYNQRKSKIIAQIYFENGSWHFSESPYLNLCYRGHRFKYTKTNVIRYSIEFDYALDYSVYWYIYKDGGYYNSFVNQEKSIEVNFDVPGKYTVMYYLKTQNGDNEFWNFPQIEIT